MAHLLGRRVKQHVAVFSCWAAGAPGLKKILHAHTDFAFDAADRLLQHARENRIRRLHLDRVLKLFVEIEHLISR